MSKSKKFKPKLTGKKQQPLTIALTSVMIVLVIVGVFWGAKNAGWLAATSSADDLTEFRFSVIDATTDKELDYWNVTVYRASIEDLTSEEIGELDYSDFELHDTVRSVYKPDEEKYVYRVKVNASGYDYQWLIPVLGINTVKLLNTTSNIVSGAMAKNTLNTTFAGTLDREWNFFVNTLDADNVLSSKEGIRSIYDFNTDSKSYIVLNLTLNTTASAKYIVASQAAEIKTNGNSLYLLYDVQIVGAFNTEIKFSSELGSSYSMSSYEFGYGDENSYVSLAAAF